MAAEKLCALRSSAAGSGATIAAIDIATGSIMRVVEVFETHMLTKPAAHIMPNTSPCGCPPAWTTML
jgi:hypothetical protein